MSENGANLKGFQLVVFLASKKYSVPERVLNCSYLPTEWPSTKIGVTQALVAAGFALASAISLTPEVEFYRETPTCAAPAAPITSNQLEALSYFQAAAFYSGVPYEKCLLLPAARPDDFRNRITAFLLFDAGVPHYEITRIVRDILWWYEHAS